MTLFVISVAAIWETYIVFVKNVQPKESEGDMKKFIINKTPCPNMKPGEVVYQYERDDFGCSWLESQLTGKEHLPVVLNPDDHNFFVVPVKCLEPSHAM